MGILKIIENKPARQKASAPSDFSAQAPNRALYPPMFDHERTLDVTASFLSWPKVLLLSFVILMCAYAGYRWQLGPKRELSPVALAVKLMDSDGHPVAGAQIFYVKKKDEKKLLGVSD